MEEPLQKSLERYDVLDRIAVGGMAEVFIAKAYGAHGFEKTIAIKRILPELARDAEFEARFIAEAKVAVRLSHANVVQVLDFGRIGESLFIAMEYVDGLDLAAMLRKFKEEKRQITLPAAFHIAIEIMRALDFAHGHNVVHRDVSPSNILISRAGEVKIADFGIAVAAQPHRNTGTGPKRVMGKWRYMSPEQTRGDTLDTRSDLFSAASVIYELFTNEKLFPGDEAEDIIKNIAEMPIPKMTAIRPNLPSRLDDVLAGPLSRKPIDRPNRPAMPLRALIELSYESSIMATALDVAEALATVIPAKKLDGRGALDDVIRKQLADQSVARRTAVTGNPPSSGTQTAPIGSTTGLFRKVDLDGLSRLEEVDVTDTRVAQPRVRRTDPILPGDDPAESGIGAMYEAKQDKDRFTEVGGPPTGQVPKDSGSWMKKPSGKTASARAPQRALWIAFAAALLAGGGVVVWAMTRHRDPPEKIPVPITLVDATPDERGTLAIDPDIEGSHGYLEVVGDESTRQEIAAITRERPFGAKVPANKRLHVHLEATGYLPYDDDNVKVPTRETLRLAPRFVVAPSRLRVVTEPPGAQVTLSGRLLGETPNTFDQLAPGKMLPMVIAKPGFISITEKVDLVPGELFEMTRTLKAGEKSANVKIDVRNGVANVYFKGRDLGEAPAKNGPLPIQLPVGKHVLQLRNNKVNPPRAWTMTCEVKEGVENLCRTKYPG